MISKYELKDLMLNTEFYGSIIICSIGFVTNLLNFHVCLRKNIRTTIAGFLNVFMSVLNILASIVFFLTFFPQSIGKDLISTYLYACILLPYSYRALLQINQWVNVIVSFDRTNMISYTVRAPQVVNKRKYSLIVLGLTVVILGVNSFNLFYSLQIEHTHNNQTSAIITCSTSSFFDWIRDIVTFIFLNVLPLAFQLAINVKLVLKILNLRNVVTTLSLRKEYRFAFVVSVYTLMLILIDGMYIFGVIIENLYDQNSRGFIEDLNDLDQIWLGRLAYSFSILLFWFLMCDLLFFINLFTNKKFRNEFRKIYLQN